MALTTTARSPRRRRRALLTAACLALGSLVAAACVPPPPPPPGPLAPMTTGVTHSVATRQVTFVDTSRATDAFGGYPGSPSRRLPTTVWYPSDGGGPFPLVVFAHGYAVDPGYYTALLRRIAAAGYVVAAPTYPLLSGQPAGPTDTVGWLPLYEDTRFVTTRVLELSSGGDPAIGGLIDPERIAVAGHSDGALLAFADGYTPFRLDPRVRAVIAYAADVGGFDVYQANQRPMLHFLSDLDEYNPYGTAIDWDRAVLQPPKTIVSLWNASHAGPFLDASDPHFDLVAKVTIGWLDTQLKAHPEGLFLAWVYVGVNSHLAAMD